MKRILFTSSVLLLCAALSGWAQAPSSFLSDASQGVFENALDDAFNPMEFSKLDKMYIFGGWTNLMDSVANNPAGNSVVFELGMHGIAPVSWSGYTMIDHAYGKEGNDIQTGKTTTYTAGANKVISGTTHKWNSKETVTEFDFTRTASFNDKLFALFSLGKIDTGLMIYYTLEDDDLYDEDGNLVSDFDLANNYTKTETFYYDAEAADPAAEPVPTLDYTVTTVESALQRRSTFGLAVPIYSVPQLLWLTYSHSSTDMSTTFKETNSARKDTAGGFTNTEKDDTINVLSSNTFGVSYSSRFPALWGTHTKNRTTAGASAFFTLNSRESSDSLITQTFTNPAGTAKGARAETITETESSGRLPFSFGLFGNHELYYDLADGLTFGLIPGANVSYTTSYSNPTETKTSTTTAKVDNDANGVFTEAGDRITTTTDTYESTACTSTGTFRASASLPASVKVKLGATPFSFVFGSRLSASAELKTEKVSNNSFARTAVVQDGEGTELSRTVTEATTPTEESTTNFSLEASASTSFGLNFVFPAGVTMDVKMNGVQLFDFDDLSVQFIIPLN